MATNRQNFGSKSITGNLAEAPERSDADKPGVAKFRLVENRRYRDRQTNEWKDADPVFYDVTIENEELAENVLQSLDKGSRVTVEGSHQVAAYLMKDGNPTLGNNIYARAVAMDMRFNPVQAQPRLPEFDKNTQQQTQNTTMQQQAPAQPHAQQPAQQQPPAQQTNAAGQALQDEAAQSWAVYQQQQQAQVPQQPGPGWN